MRVQCFGDISVLLEKPEPATIRVSSLKVGHWRRLVILIIVDDEGCGEGRQLRDYNIFFAIID